METGAASPILCSCLENPRDAGAWWAAVYGVTQSRTQLKRLSSSSPTLGACAGGRCHMVIQGSRQPEAPPAGDTVVVSIALGPALAACVAVMLQGRSRRIGSTRVTFAPCLFQPRSTPFSQNRLRHTCMYHFLFCLMFNLYLDSIETLQSDLTLEFSVAGAPHATGGCPKAPSAVLLGSPCTSVSSPAP